MGPHWWETSLTKGLREPGLEGWSKVKPVILHPLWFSLHKLHLEAQTPGYRGWQGAREEPWKEEGLHLDKASTRCFFLKPWEPRRKGGREHSEATMHVSPQKAAR